MYTRTYIHRCTITAYAFASLSNRRSTAQNMPWLDLSFTVFIFAFVLLQLTITILPRLFSHNMAPCSMNYLSLLLYILYHYISFPSLVCFLSFSLPPCPLSPSIYCSASRDVYIHVPSIVQHLVVLYPLPLR